MLRSFGRETEKETNLPASDQSPRLSPEELDALEARINAATMGPWQVLRDDAIASAWLNADLPDDDKAIALFDYRDGGENIANAEFSALARNQMPRLITEIRALRSRIQELLEANGKEVDRRTLALRERDEALARLAALTGEPQAPGRSGPPCKPADPVAHAVSHKTAD